MDPLRYFFQALILGLVSVFVWIAFWGAGVPAMFGGQVWAGHEQLAMPVFFLGCLAGLVLPLLPRR